MPDLRATWRRLNETASALLFEVVLAVSAAITFPLTINALGPDDYGKYSLTYTFTGLAASWVVSSAGVALIQLLVQQRPSVRRSLWVAKRQVLLMAVPVGAAGTVIVSTLVGASQLPAVLVIFGTEMFVAGMTEMNVSALYAHRGQGPTTRVRLAAPIVKVAGVVTLFALDEVSITTLAVVNLLAALACLVMAHRAVNDMYGRTGLLDLEASADLTPRSLWRCTVTHGVSISAYTAQNDGDDITIGIFRSDAELGRYAAAYRLVSMAMLPMRALMTVSYRKFLVHDPNAKGQHLRRAKRLITPLAVYGTAVGVGVFVFQPITRWLLGDGFGQAVTITLWLSAFPILRALVDIPLLGLLGLGLNRVRMLLGLAGAVVAVVAYLIFVPSMGWRGGIIGTYASEVFVATAGWIALAVFERRHDARQQSMAPAVADL